MIQYARAWYAASPKKKKKKIAPLEWYALSV